MPDATDLHHDHRGAWGPSPQVLIPFDRREGCSIEMAAEISGKSGRTMRLWCEQHQIGRRIAGGPWLVSVVALQMLLDGDDIALRAYLSGDRSSDLVAGYYQRASLSGLIKQWTREPTLP